MFGRNGKMRLSKGLLMTALIVTIATPALAAQDMTVGQFVQELARSRGLESTDGITALEALSSSGVAMPVGLHMESNLTERDVVSLSRAVGLNVTSSQPNKAFDASHADRFFASFSRELAHGAQRAADGEDSGQETFPGMGENDPPFNPFTKGKGKNKGGVSEIDPS